MFQSTYLYKVRQTNKRSNALLRSFNPRTYIRYDFMPMMFPIQTKMFQSTYLYKVRLKIFSMTKLYFLFQSTYLYKVRHIGRLILFRIISFNPRTYIRYDTTFSRSITIHTSFNPRTYIRYDPGSVNNVFSVTVSIHVPI